MNSDYNFKTEPHEGKVTFTNMDFSEYEDDFRQLAEISSGLINELAPFDGMFEANNPHQIRTGIIQDPQSDIFFDRYNTDGTLKKSAYSVLDSTEAEYPFNGINSIDPYGFRVSIVWIDGFDGGLYQGTNSGNPGSQPADLKATLKAPVQKIWLTFPNCWSDLDRSCGDFHMPLPGTIVRVAMARGNVGTIVGTKSMDPAKLPIMRLGDSMKRHFNQSVFYMTDQALKDAYKNILDKDIHKPAPILEPRPGTNEFPKPYETDSSVLSNIRKYTPHRQVISSDGVSSSTKVTEGKHGTIDNKRTLDWNTNLTLENAIQNWKDTVTVDNFTSFHILCPEGDLRVTQDDEGNHSVELVTKLTIEESLTKIKNKLKPKHARIVAKDGVIEFSCNPTTVLSTTTLLNPSITITTKFLTIAQLATLIPSKFTMTLSHAIDIRCKDAIVYWCDQAGEARSSELPAAALLVAVETIMGRSGRYYDVYGIDMKLAGYPLPVSGDCPPYLEVPVDTCHVPLLDE